MLLCGSLSRPGEIYGPTGKVLQMGTRYYWACSSTRMKQHSLVRVAFNSFSLLPLLRPECHSKPSAAASLSSASWSQAPALTSNPSSTGHLKPQQCQHVSAPALRQISAAPAIHKTLTAANLRSLRFTLPSTSIIHVVSPVSPGMDGDRAAVIGSFY